MFAEKLDKCGLFASYSEKSEGQTPFKCVSRGTKSYFYETEAVADVEFLYVRGYDFVVIEHSVGVGNTVSVNEGV